MRPRLRKAYGAAGCEWGPRMDTNENREGTRMNSRNQRQTDLTPRRKDAKNEDKAGV
jgi:hypothetical protein